MAYLTGSAPPEQARGLSRTPPSQSRFTPLLTFSVPLIHAVGLKHSSSDASDDGVTDSEFGDLMGVMGDGAWNLACLEITTPSRRTLCTELSLRAAADAAYRAAPVAPRVAQVYRVLIGAWCLDSDCMYPPNNIIQVGRSTVGERYRPAARLFVHMLRCAALCVATFDPCRALSSP